MQLRTCEKIIYTGQYAEVEVFPEILHPKARRAKYRPTTEAQAHINQAAAERRLHRLIHTNFTSDDLAVHITYSAKHEPAADDIDTANKDIKNFLRRLRRFYAKAKAELKYIYSVEYSSRWHFHLIINSAGSGITDLRDKIEKLWGKGLINADRLQFSNSGVSALANYIQKQHLNYRRWTASKNLVKPKEQKQFINRKAKADYVENWSTQALVERRFPEYTLVLDGSDCVLNPTNGFEYIRLFLIRKDAKLSYSGSEPAPRKPKPRQRLIEDRDIEDEWIQPRIC